MESKDQLSALEKHEKYKTNSPHLCRTSTLMAHKKAGSTCARMRDVNE